MHPDNFARKWQYFAILLFFKVLWWDFKKSNKLLYTYQIYYRIYCKPTNIQVLKLYFPNARPETRNYALFHYNTDKQ